MCEDCIEPTMANQTEFSEWAENGCAKAAEIILQSESNEEK